MKNEIKNTAIFYQNVFFKSYAQLFFEEKKLFGICLFLIILSDYNVFLSTFLSLSSALISSKFFGFKEEQIKDGFFGVNPFLCGGCASIFYPGNFLLAVLTGILCTLTMKIFSLVFTKFKLPILSGPFIFTFAFIMIFIRQSIPSSGEELPMNYTDFSPILFAKEILFCFSSMCFLTQWWQGLLVLFVFAFFNLRNTALCLLSIVCVLFLFRLLNYGYHFTSVFFLGFNFILTCIASVIFFPENINKLYFPVVLTLTCSLMMIFVYHFISIPLNIGVFSIPFFIVIFGSILAKKLIYDSSK